MMMTTNTATPTNFIFEIYTRNSETGESGWNIEVGVVRDATSQEAAIATIKRHFGRLFDEIINCYRANLNNGDGTGPEWHHLDD